jgi:hypothetical protein
MERDATLRLVRTLTLPVLELFSPDQVEEFEDDFAVWALDADVLKVSEQSGPLPPRARSLDATLVAGMFFQVVTEASRLPAGHRERVSFVRKKAKDYLVTQLAGQITLSQFYRLLNLIEGEVGHYFARQEWPGSSSAPQEAAPPARPSPVNAEALRQALAKLPLPLKGRRKLTPETLGEFLRETAGQWFRLPDFEARFQVHKKTAWSYLHLLLKAGILNHNGEKANRVRYALTAPFSTVPSDEPIT